MFRTLKYLVMILIFLSSHGMSQNKSTDIDLNNLKFQNIPNSLLSGISIHLEEATMQFALTEIAQKGAIKLNYNSDIIPLEKKVSIQGENINTIEALLIVLKQTSTKLQITKGGSLIILPEDEPKGKIKGVVLDASSGDPLIGANIMIEGTSIGAAANIDGKFSLNLDPGNYNLKVSYVGFVPKTESITVVSNRSTEIIVKLDWVAVEGDVVLVTAQAKGQLAAINAQLSSDEIKNVVSKDRIRELPDANAAESVGRLPGVSLLRSGGEGNKVVIRGMQPKYSKIMVDGVALPPNGSDDRSVSMGMISSYSLEGIEVIKSPTADKDGDQIGGSVNFVMKTAPKGLNYEIVGQGGYNSLRKSYNDYMFLGSISDRFFDNSFGVFAQISVDQKNMATNKMSASYHRRDDSIEMSQLLIHGLNLTDIFRIRNRYNGSFTLDYIIPNGKIYFKNFFSSGKTATQEYEEEFSRRTHLFNALDENSSEMIYSNILSYEQEVSIFKINAKLSHSFSSSDVPNALFFTFGDDNDIGTYSPDIAPNEIIKYAENNFDKISWTKFKDATSYIEGRHIMAKMDFSTDFTLSNKINGKIKFGGKFRYDEHSYDYDGFHGSLTTESSLIYKRELLKKIPQLRDSTNNFTYNYRRFLDGDFSRGDFINGEYELGPVADVELMRHIVDILEGVYDTSKADYNQGYSHMEKSSVIDDYTGIERLNAGYLMAEFNITDKVTFIPGIRYEDKTTIYNGVFGKSGSKPEVLYTHTDTSATRNNSFWLPMIHLRYEPLSWLQIRAAYTHTIARPDFRYILPNMDLDPSAGVTMNNPDLRPEHSENFDLYFSFNENHLGLFSLGGFWKNIDDKIFSRGDKILEHPEDYNIDQSYTGTSFETQENNKERSTVKGVEIDWQTNFWYLPSFLSGIVLNINYTKIFSKTKYPLSKYVFVKDDQGKRKRVEIDKSYWDRLLNQPGDIVNVSVGYDYKDFSGRLSMNYSSDIFIDNDKFQEKRRLSDDYTRWDLSLAQKLPWQGLQIYCNITNLSQAISQNHLFGGNKLKSMKYYGSSIYLGIKWRTE